MPDTDCRKDLYDRIRDQIQHEDLLVNQRLTWFLVAQAFLFAGYHAVLNSNRETLRARTLIAICLLGFVLAIAAYLGIFAAFRSLKTLYQTWYEFNEWQLNEQFNIARLRDAKNESQAEKTLLISCQYLPEEQKKMVIDGELFRQGYPQITWRGKGLITAANTACL